MKSLELVQEVTKGVKEKGLKVNQNLVKEVLAVTEEVVEKVVLNDDSVTVLGAKFTSKEQKGRKGVINFGAKAGETYETTDKIVPSVKFTPTKRAQLTREK